LTAFLSILRDFFRCPICALTIEFSPWHNRFRSLLEQQSFSCQQSIRADTTSLLSLQAES
jgi:hypothetical protein